MPTKGPDRPTTTTPELNAIGGAASSLSEVSREPVEQECQQQATVMAEAQAASSEASAVTMQQSAMRARWLELKGLEAGAMRLTTASERAPLISAVEVFIRDASALRVTQSERVLSVAVKLRPSAAVGEDVDCGTRQAVVAARSTAVPVAEVKEAEALLARLKSSDVVHPVYHSQIEWKRRVEPTYPAEARGLGTSEIHCKVTVRVNERGVPYDLTIDGCPTVFHDETRATLKRWRARPTKVNGKAVKVQTTIVVRYREL